MNAVLPGVAQLSCRPWDRVMSLTRVGTLMPVTTVLLPLLLEVPKSST
jgi:hypothetical protein